jgi:hypothetical protein
VPFLKDDFGPKLDDFEAALSKLDKARETKHRSDPALAALRATLKTALTKVNETAVSYEKQLRYMTEHATNPEQKKALSGAAAFLFTLLGTKLRDARSRL